jgi:transposase
MRTAPKIEVTPQDLKILTKWSKSRTEPKQAIERAKIILLCYEGKSVKEVAETMQTYPNKVIEWRNRYMAEGINGLLDKQRSGKPVTYIGLRERVLLKLGSPPPKGYGRWDAPLLAKELNCSPDAVWRILKKDEISLVRQRSWCISTDKEFVPKAADIIGLYLNPPLNAIVICVDEKPSIQALERKTGYIQTSDGRIQRAYKSTYKRNGTLNLFAALEVATGKIATKVTKHKTREDFIEYMDEVVGEYQEDQEIHVILDNYSTHKKNEIWLSNHPNVQFHFTPTSASWLNQVEIWFGIFSRKSLAGASFRNTEELREQIETYVKNYNKHSKPFKWRKREVRGSQIKNNIANLRN